MSSAFEDRGRALEDQFFHQKNQQLLDKFRASLMAKEAKEALASASGITDDALLQTLVEMKIQAETLASLSLLPLVAVAWADGKMDAAESKAILKAAQGKGIEAGSPAQAMVESWLTTRPDGALMLAWREYVGALKESLDAPAFDRLKTEILSQARKVAEAAGGMLGMGNKVSPTEKAMLDDLSAAFDAD